MVKVWETFFFLLIPLISALIPLITSTGRNLEYEYSLMSSFLVLFFFILGMVAKQRKIDPKTIRMDAKKILVALLGFYVPGAVLLATKLCQCSSGGFLFWQTFHPVATFLICLGISQTQSIKAKWMILAVLAVCTLEALQLWIFPQKRLLSVFIGFFHGPVYDQEILLSWPLLTARFATVGFYLSITLISSKLIRSVSMVISLTLFAISVQHPFLGHGQGKLKKVLPDTVKKELFILHFDREKLSDAEVQSHVDQASFHTHELREILRDFSIPTTHIYLYHSKKKKKYAFGAGNTDVADVYTPSIHITAEPFPHSTLRHELVHSMTSDFAFHGLGFHPNMALTEGLAVALAPNRRLLSLDIGSGHLIDSGRIDNIESLFSFNFWKYSGSRAYTIAGSFLNFLIDTYGSSSALKLYSGSSISEATGHPLEQVLADWKEKVLGSYDVTLYETLSDRLYRSPGILYSVCPHSRVDLAKTNPSPLERLLQPPFFDAKTDYQDWLHSLPTAGSLAKKPDVLSYNDIKQSLVQIDEAMLQKDTQKARVLYKKVMQKTEGTYLGAPLYRALAVRSYYIDHPNTQNRSLFLKVLSGQSKLSSIDSLAEEALDPISSYLFLRWNEPKSSISQVKTLDDSFQSLTDKNLYVEIAARSIAARSYVRLGSYAEAAAHYLWLKRNSLSGERDYFDSLYRFSDFMLKSR